MLVNFLFKKLFDFYFFKRKMRATMNKLNSQMNVLASALGGYRLYACGASTRVQNLEQVLWHISFDGESQNIT